MATLMQPKQINKLLQASIFISALAFAAGASTNIAASLTTAAGTAGDNGVSVPVQAASATAPGFVVSGNNVVQVWDSVTKTKLADSKGNEIYGRLTNAGAVYTLSLYSLIAGVETAYTAASALSIDIEVSYLFDFATYPRDAATGLDGRYIINDPSNGASKYELVAVTAVDTLAALTQAPNTGKLIELVVNGQTLTSVELPAPFSVVGTAVTWSAVNAGFALATTDIVVAKYSV